MKITITRYNETYIKVESEKAVKTELWNFFTYMVPGAAFIPAVQNRFWDGKIHLYSLQTGLLYYGLHPHVVEWCKKNGYCCEYSDPLDVENEFSVVEAQKMFSLLQLSREVGDPLHPRREDVTPHDYQERAIIHAIQAGRSLLLSPTASGKSLIIYILLRYYLAKTKGKVLIVVPNGGLVNQMFDDFEDYSHKINWDANKHCHKLYDGSAKETEKRILISTWQSLAVKERLPQALRKTMTKPQITAWNKKAAYILDQDYFNQFETVFGDEAHQFAADELAHIMTKLVNARFRHGTTGTLKDSKVNSMILEGLFGQVYQTTTTRQMIDDGKAAELDINILQLQYSDEERRLMKKTTYQEEMEFLQAHEGRTNFICNLALSLKGNTLILYEKIEKHGQIIHDQLDENRDPDRKLFFIYGDVEPDERNDIRDIVEGETNAIIVASYGTYSTGVSIRNLDNVISVAVGKSKIRIFQSIGRGLRLSERKTKMHWYDIADDLSLWNKGRTELHSNYSLQHLMERITYYNGERFDYRTYKIELTNQ